MQINLKNISRLFSIKYLILNTLLVLLLSTAYLLHTTYAHATDPLPDPYIDCNNTTNPEFHSDRPYQASPCNEPPGTPPQEPQALLCGNDLAFKETLTVTPSEAISCTTLASGGRRCNYKVNPGVRIKIDLSNTDLPILGNTEDVPNSTQNTMSLDPATRVNEYLNWYLNGVISPATEEDRTDYPSSKYSLVENPPSPEFINNLINFSGPIRKLLPWSGQAREKVSQIEYAIGATGSNASKLRHDQIIGCTVQFLIGEKPANCYFPPSNLLSGIFHRLSSWVEHLPPFEEYYSKAKDYWKAMNEWRGGICFDTAGGYTCLNTGVAHYWSQLFDYIPFTSTEDKKGSLQFVGKSEPSIADQGDVKVTSQSFSPTNPDTTKFLYFPHTEESAQLGEILQKTYLPKDEEGYTPEDGSSQNSQGSQTPNTQPQTDSQANQGATKSKADNLDNCVVVAGDSVAHGDITYAYPPNGTFPSAQTGTIAEELIPRLPSGFTTKDESQSATSLNVPGEEVYNDSNVVSSKCRYKVLGPWVNDFGKGEVGPTMNAINTIINRIQSSSPDSKILLIEYYSPRPWVADFLNIWPMLELDDQLIDTSEPSTNQRRRDDFNSQMKSQFGQKKNVYLIDISYFSIPQLASSYSVDGGEYVADRVHLSSDGKIKLADAIAEQISTLEQEVASGTSNNTITTQPSQPKNSSTSSTGLLVPGGNCEILDSRTNPGDDVFGEYTEEGDNQIEGVLNYTAEFTCDFPQARPSNFCEANCNSGDTACMDACLGGKCKKDITIVAGSVFTKTPNADEIFQRFVTGAFSAFRRIFPQVGAGAPVTELEDIPAVTSANYGAIPSERSGDVTPLAGNPSNNRPGGSAQIFISHIGSVSEYFLKGIQTALRPKGYGNPIVSGSQDLGIHPPTSDWEFDGNPVSNPPPDNPEIQTAINQAANDIGIPVCVLEGVGIIEGAYGWTPDDPRITACKPNQCSAAGPFQISTGRDASGDRFCSQCSAWTRAYGCPNVWAGRSGSPCDFVLSANVAAQKLKNDGPLNNSQSVQEQRNQIINAGYHYYGSNGKIPRLDNCSYGQYVYKHCDPSYNCN